jgi:protein-S-isoprenylcysteine O-methyltransferase Ste14
LQQGDIKVELIPEFKIGIWNAWIFSACFILIPYSLFFIKRTVYKKFGNPSNIKLDKRAEIIGYIATAIYYIVFLYTIFLPLKLWTPWFYTGLIIFLLALVLFITAGINFIAAPPGKPATKGIYSYSRHPIYFSNFLALISIGIAAASWIILMFSIISMILTNIVANSEEFYCKEKFGSSYKDYMERTPKWIGIPR